MNDTEQMAERLRILAEAAHEFSATTQDLEALLSVVARRLAEVVKDLCVVRVLSEDGKMLVPVAIHARDEDGERLARAALSEPVSLEQHHLSRQVHESGEPFFAPRLDLEELSARVPPALIQYGKDAGAHSALLVPLRLRGRSIGQLLLQRYGRRALRSTSTTRLSRALWRTTRPSPSATHAPTPPSATRAPPPRRRFEVFANPRRRTGSCSRRAPCRSSCSRSRPSFRSP